MPNTLDFWLLTDALLPVVRQAGEAILQFYHKPIEVVTKDDGSPTTAADAAAEAIVVEALARITPHIPVVAEEASADGHTPMVKEALWLVDPLDGTREFIKKTDEFTVNLGLVHHGKPVYGIIYAPALDRLFVGYGKTMRRWEKGIEQPVETPPALRQNALRIVGSRSHRDKETEALLSGLPVATNVSAGSSLKFCLVANGEADLYPRLGRTMEWDTAAGDAIVRAAGGQVVCLDGTPLAYNKQQEGYANPSFIVTRGGLSWPISTAA
jgi:3'(2'), 5'-bisphosphate nucleotidase